MGVRRRRRARRGRGGLRRDPPLLRDPKPRARRCERSRRDLPARLDLDARYHDRVGAGRADLTRLERRRARRQALRLDRPHDRLRADAGRRVHRAALHRLARSRVAVLAPLPLLSIGFGRYSKRYAERTKVNQAELGELTALVEETIAGIRVVKGLGAGAALDARFRRRSNEVVRTRARRGERRRGVPARARGAAARRHPRRALVRRAPRARGRHHGRHVRRSSPSTSCCWSTRCGRSDSASARCSARSRPRARVAEVLGAEPDVVESAVATVDAGARGRSLRERPLLLRRRPAHPGRILARHPGGHVARARRRDRLGQVDRGGAARALLRPGCGRGHDRRGRRARARLDELRRGVGLVFEETFLFGDTVRGNVGFATPDASEAAVERAARLAGAARLRRAAARRVRDGARRARLLALGRPAAAASRSPARSWPTRGC